MDLTLESESMDAIWRWIRAAYIVYHYLKDNYADMMLFWKICGG